MPYLTVKRGTITEKIEFKAPALLDELLASSGFELMHPCSKRGVCGKCAVMIDGDISPLSKAEQKLNTRLSCQTVVYGDAKVILPDEIDFFEIESGSDGKLKTVSSANEYGVAIDIGTTSVVLKLYSLENGKCLSNVSILNPQTSVSADVIGRIEASMGGSLDKLKDDILSAIDILLKRACAAANISFDIVRRFVITGNTTMLYLLTGKVPVSLSRAPFEADCLFGCDIEKEEKTVYLPPCFHAFAGADLLCAVLSSGMLESEKTSLLCDVGTNGEIALWHNGKLYTASTAAGPAFEGAGISCGSLGIGGAIDKVWTDDEKIAFHTIGDKKAIGICGSGLVDVIACLLEIGYIDETGYMEDEEYSFCEEVKLYQKDVRAVQLAKSAICSGIEAVLKKSVCSFEEVKKFYIAGGFGSHINIKNASGIGLFPKALEEKAVVIGNAALDGAAMLLADISLRDKMKSITDSAIYVKLDGNPYFSDRFVENMLFEQ